MTSLDVLVPDIGDFTEVPVAEILVGVGDEVAAEDPLVVLESDKASMEIPAPQAGTVQEIKVAVGDAVSEGSALVVLGVAEAAGPAGGGAGGAGGAGGGAGAGAVESPAQPESAEEPAPEEPVQVERGDVHAGVLVL